MSLRRRYLEPPQLHWTLPHCDNCYVETELEDDGQFSCPECGTWWDANGNPDSFQDWEDNDIEVIPDLFLDNATRVSRDAVVTVEMSTHEESRYIFYRIVIDGENYYSGLAISGELEKVQQTVDLLQDRIKQHYQLQDQRKKTNDL